MLYIRVELWPGGDRARRTLLGEGFIANVGGTVMKGNYRYAFVGRNRTGDGERTQWQVKRALFGNALTMGAGELFGFPRRRLHAWDLVFRALRAARGTRNPEPV